MLQGQSRVGDLRSYGTALLAALAYYAGAKLGLALTFSPLPISVLWPPNAILLAALLLTPVRSWWLILLATFPSHLLAELQGGVPLVMVLCWFASNASEALIGAVCLHRLLGRPPDFGRVQDTGIFLVCAGLLAPFVSSFIDAAFVRLMEWSQIGYWELWRTRVRSNILAALTIVPVIVTWATAGGGLLRGSTLERVLEGMLLLCGLLAVGTLVFNASPSEAETLPALLYLPLPFLLWAALRFGPPGSSAAFMTVAFLVIWGTAHGRGPFIASAPLENANSVQMFLIFVSATLLMLAASVQERRDSERRLRSSEQRFSTAFHSSPDAMAITRKTDGTLIDVNARWLELFDFRREDVIGRTAYELNLHVNEKDTLVRLTRERGFVRDHEMTLRNRHGATVETVIAAETVEVEGVPCFITTIRDVTALRRATESLQHNDERFRLVLRATNDVIYDWDIVADKLWWNHNGELFFGSVSEDGPGDYEAWTRLLHPEDRERVMSRLQELIDGGGQVFHAEYRLRRTEGTYAHVNVRGFIVRDEAGKPLRMIGSLMDITDRKRVEEAKQRLAHVSRLAVMGELTASIAHEINQPLGAILSNVDALDILLASNVIPVDEVRQIVDDIRHDDMRAGEVIKHMRALSRKHEMARQPFDLNRAISDVLHLVSADLARHRVVAESEFAPLPVVHGDQVQLQQVMLNLILNGLEAMADTPASLRRIGIRTERTDRDGVGVTVWDSGPGIAPGQAAYLFDSFFTTKPDGMGLGLAIAKSIVEAHGGTIRAETRREGGANFSFFLPCR